VEVAKAAEEAVFLSFLEILELFGFFGKFWLFWQILAFLWQNLDFLKNIGGTYRVQKTELHDRLYLT
jgi:hypothetical protein